MSTILNNKDEMIMSLVHYFVTEENYTPINVQGAKNEIWLENLEAPYKIVRINSKYIHNNEQYNMDLFKMQFVIKQIKKKTLSFKMNALNICLDLGQSVELTEENKTIDTVNVTSINDIKKNKFLSNIYPKITTNSFKKTDNLDKIINVTEDINRKTETENKKYENIFKPKRIIVTKILIAICIAMYFVSLFLTDNFASSLIILGANNRGLVLSGEFYRLITSAFLHGSIAHLLVNMYSLWVIGSQVETYLGKVQYLVIYLLSALMGSLFSIVFLETSLSVGASGAIFGLMGSLLYFGYHYRLYLSNALTGQIIPIIILNLILGFTMSGIDNAAHIGGLIGGYLATMIVGIKYKSTKRDNINGLIVYFALAIFLFYVVFKLV
ncbi:MAG: rhomboid family intramembrane serine protease [Firmicutes bacterium]|nr:rhomboid family intramembrane serine protease [Bacillota bacterium]